MNIDALRHETPGTAHRVHLNNAGASLMPLPVLDRVTRHLRREAEIGGYEAAQEAEAELEAVYERVARLINASPDEIALTENATVAWQMAFYAQPFRAGDRILTTRAEYAANFVAFLHMARTRGVRIDVVPNDAHGVLDLSALEEMMDDRVRLIAISWIPTNGGLVNPAAGVGRIARKFQVPYLLDACQAVGQMQVDVAALGCDMLAATGRKFLRGPRGTGFLFVRRDKLHAMHPPMVDHHAAPWVAPDRYQLRPDARRFETWEKNWSARLGLGTAIDYALSVGIDNIESRCKLLADRARDGLRACPRIRVHDLGRHPSAIVSFSADGVDAGAIRAGLAERKINVSLSRPSSTLLDATERGLPTLVRASPHYFNTKQEVDALVAACRTLTASAE